MKTLVFCSNFLTHHQLPFCNEMHEILGDGFKFVATEPINAERLNLGYKDLNESYPFVVRSYESGEKLELAKHLADESDVAIHGSAPESFIRSRCKKGKLTFRYTERLFKRGLSHIVSPKVQKYLFYDNYLLRNSPLYLLCAGAYVYEDFRRFGLFNQKAIKWGYFPEVIHYDIEEILKNKNQGAARILWAGRFIDWKHPEKALLVAEFLRDKGIDFSMTMIGTGDLLQKTRETAKSRGLSESVSIPGSMSPEAVRSEMENAGIFLFTSDRNEGWGAVLNEAMNSGCAVIANRAIGSVPYLLKDGINGCIYDDGDDEALCEKAASLARSVKTRNELGRNAYWTMSSSWNAENAAQRLVRIADLLLEDGRLPRIFEDGPCSPETGELR
jgi:glycosyltransferase involved in cell wall biosynthesis